MIQQKPLAAQTEALIRRGDVDERYPEPYRLFAAVLNGVIAAGWTDGEIFSVVRNEEGGVFGTLRRHKKYVNETSA